MIRTLQVAAILILAACGLATATPAQAQVYWRIEAGWSAPNDAEFKDNDFYNSGNIWGDPTGTQPGTLNNIDGSLIVGAGVGYRFTSGLRGDVTLTYRGFYDLNEATFEARYNASITSTALMVNGYYDFSAGGVRPPATTRGTRGRTNGPPRRPRRPTTSKRSRSSAAAVKP